MKKARKTKQQNNKNKNKNKKRLRITPSNQRNAQHVRAKRRPGQLGIFDRDYPADYERQEIIKSIRGKDEASRSSDDWWRLGEYLTYDGLMDENDSLVNEGIQALTRGANHETPSPACSLDLAWILMFRGLDGMALPYLEKAVQISPKSRDAWSLKGMCHIGNSQREEAIHAYEKAIQRPQATEADKSILSDLHAGKDLREIRKSTVLRKIEPEALCDGRYQSQEKAKMTVQLLKPLLETSPNDVSLIEALAHARYTLDQFEKTRPLLLQLIDIEGGHAKAYTMLGLIAKKKDGDIQAAIDFYKNALEVDPDHLLALVNIASALQDNGNYHEARPLLQRALQGDQSDINYGLALDLMGSNIGCIDHDYITEAQLHEQAAQLDATHPSFRSNQIVALLSAGEEKKAREVWTRYRSALQTIPFYNLLQGLVEAYTKDLGHPYPYMQLVDQTNSILGWPAMAPLVKKAWQSRSLVLESNDNEEKHEFITRLGMLAGHADCSELALDIWRTGAKLPNSEEFLANQVVELSQLARHGEALELAEKMSMDIPRSFTILGNTRKAAGQFLAAIGAYREALILDPEFLMPISNALDCIEIIKMPDQLPPFEESLLEQWGDTHEGQLLLARSLLLSGRPDGAASDYSQLLYLDGELTDPRDSWEKYQADTKDLSLWSTPDTQHYKALGKALILSGRHTEFENLYHSMVVLPEWTDGDWKVLLAESYRRRGELEKAKSILEDMPLQPPPLVSRSLCAVEQGYFEEAKKLAENAILSSPTTSEYSHIEGGPDSVAHSILAICALEDGDPQTALELADTAVKMDIGSAIARTTRALSLTATGQPGLAMSNLEEGLVRNPGSPTILRMLIEYLVDAGRAQDASIILETQRPLISNHGTPGLAEALGELIALRLLAETRESAEVKSEASLPWLQFLENDSKSWISSAISMQSDPEMFGEAYGLYISKVAEKELLERLFAPFKLSIQSEKISDNDMLQDLSRFIHGGYPPSIGGMVRSLIAANNNFRSSDHDLVINLRNFLRSSPRDTTKYLRNDLFLKRLKSLASTRNALAHITQPNLSKVMNDTSIVLDGDKPGDLLIALYPDLAAHL